MKATEVIFIRYDKALVTQYASFFKKVALPKSALPMDVRVLCFEVGDHYNATHNIITELHHHSFFEIHLVLEGETAYECQGRVMCLSAGEGLIIPPELEHKYLSSSEDFVKSVISFTFDRIDGDALPISVTAARMLPFPEEVFEAHAFIFRLCGKNDAFTPHLILGRIIEMLYSLFKTLEITLPDNPNKDTDPRFLTAKTFIDKNQHRLLTCEDVAKECCLSTKQMGRIIHSATGMSLSQYITVAKLGKAKELLCEEKYTMKQICFMLGFASESSFTLFFKRHQGIPPGTYRAEMLGNLDSLTAHDGEKQ